MLRRCIITILAITIITTSFVYAFGASKQVTVTIPSFPVKLNELKFDNNDYAKYPLLVYRDITYFPMTYYQSNLLNLNTSWTAEGGLVITKGNSGIPKEFAYEAPVSNRNIGSQTATIIDTKVTVNGKIINNQNEQYPLLLFRNVTYFPMTWRFAVDEFGWSYTFDSKTGLNIIADNYFYTANGDSYKNVSGESVSIDNETYYIMGDLRISVRTETNRMGPVVGNLTIKNNDNEINPNGYFGYYQKNGPLFSIDGNYINTVYYTDPDTRNSVPCRVNIETGQIN